jgi:hypothetical protein
MYIAHMPDELSKTEIQTDPLPRQLPSGQVRRALVYKPAQAKGNLDV